MGKDIDFALVEGSRPPMYTAMKYWGKKPHNVWAEYIKTYTLENGVILDPFSGSAIAAFEAVRLNRKAIAFDLNPLTAFIIEVYSTPYNDKKFKSYVNEIYSMVQNDRIYKKFYNSKCPVCGQNVYIQHFKWNFNKIYEYGLICPHCGKRTIIEKVDSVNELVSEINDIEIDSWYPKDSFYDSPSFSNAFKEKIGGNNFSDLWTKRNLYVLSKIFFYIESVEDTSIKRLLMFGFIQTLHLSSKMCVPRNKKSKRDFSTSWGRSAYICSNKQMEMNPLLLFYNNCIGKQSVESALKSVRTHIGKIPSIYFVKDKFDEIKFKKCDIAYGIVDIKKINRILPNNIVDFVITDPPYGGLVQYIDLSQIWLIWLFKYDNKFKANVDDEITVKKNQKDINIYNKEFANSLANISKIMKDEAKIVFTFHNKDTLVWNSFLCSIDMAKFKIEKVIHQQNKRTGESNVSNPYGTSGSDFYIRCSKRMGKCEKIEKKEFETYVLKTAIELIRKRNEPTPFQILFNGILSEVSLNGMQLNNFDKNIMEILEKYKDKYFIVEESLRLSGNLWWIKEALNTDNNCIPLSIRVEKSIETLLLDKGSVAIDDVLAMIFKEYPNGLTPDIKLIEYYLEKIAIKSNKKWVIKMEGVNKDGR